MALSDRMQQRDREVRDIYMKLYKSGKYSYHFTLELICNNYFLQPQAVLNIMRRVDNTAVVFEKSSFGYQQIMSPDFKVIASGA